MVMPATKYSNTWQCVGCGVVWTPVVRWQPNTPSMVAGGMYSPEEDIPILTRKRYICLYSPAVHHERVDSSWTARGWGLALMVLELSHHIRIVEMVLSQQTRSNRGQWHSSTRRWLWSTPCRTEPQELSTWLGSSLPWSRAISSFLHINFPISPPLWPRVRV